MITAYLRDDPTHPLTIDQSNHNLLPKAVWVDVFSPATEELTWLEQGLCITMPTRAAMQEIEISSRLYTINQTLYMTATFVAGAASGNPKSDSITFILKSQHLLTLRYIEPSSFVLLSREIRQLNLQTFSAAMLLVYLLELAIDRLADSLEMIAGRLEEYSKSIFHPSTVEKHEGMLDYAELMQQVGQHAELTSQIRESLLTLNRLISFFTHAATIQLDQPHLTRLQALNKDIVSLSDYTVFVTSKVNFLLDATLGMINIEQNNIIKIFSVAAVIFLPPTLIASIYGMNFHHLPELGWQYGYLLALGMMFLSAFFTYHFFKKRKWL